MTRQINRKPRANQAKSQRSRSSNRVAKRSSPKSSTPAQKPQGSKLKQPPSNSAAPKSTGTGVSKPSQSSDRTSNQLLPANASPSYRYVSQQDKQGAHTVQGGQINYGPGKNLTPVEKQALKTHYGENGKTFADKRLDQYDSSHQTYVEAVKGRNKLKVAEGTNRPLTEQEQVAKDTKKNAPNSSINHIIASGTGQNIRNHETLRFNQGKAQVDGAANLSPADRQKKISLGLANQAAAVGRVQGYNRAIIDERHDEPLNNHPTTKRIYGQHSGTLDSEKTRNQAMKHTLTAFQGKNPDERSQAYKDVSKMTFDSPGNLRVGDKYGNNQASTGFDAPLDRNSKPTPEAERLLAAHQAFVPDHLENQMFTKDADGNRVSSSQFAPNSNKRKLDETNSLSPNKKRSQSPRPIKQPRSRRPK